MMKINREDITQEIVRELIDYCPETGDCIWKERPLKYCVGNGRQRPEHNKAIWDAQNAGKLAMSVPNLHGYPSGYLLSIMMQAHRVIWLYMTGKWPEGEIDHINGDRADNRWSNLRCVSPQTNGRNKAMICSNTSGKMGVSKYKNKYRAYITVRRKQIHLGMFNTFEEASEARENAEKEFCFHENHGRK